MARLGVSCWSGPGPTSLLLPSLPAQAYACLQVMHMPAFHIDKPQQHEGMQDCRVLPDKIFGLELGDAEYIRNAGGRVTDDVIRCPEMMFSAHTQLLNGHTLPIDLFTFSMV